MYLCYIHFSEIKRNSLGNIYLVEGWSPEFEVICKPDKHALRLLSITERDVKQKRYQGRPC